MRERESFSYQNCLKFEALGRYIYLVHSDISYINIREIGEAGICTKMKYGPTRV